MEYNFFTWWLSTKVKPLAFKIWRYTISPINFLALTLFVAVFQEYFINYFLMMFLPIIFIDIVWDGFNFSSYYKDRRSELQTINDGEKLVEENLFNDEYCEIKSTEEKNGLLGYKLEPEIAFEEEKTLEVKRSVLTKLKDFLTFSKDKNDGQPTVSKERKREIKLKRKYDIAVWKNKKQFK